MKTTFIYALIDPRDNQIRYIGKSDNPSKRLFNHLNEKSITHKTNWIKLLQKLDLKPELFILDEVPVEEWDFWEIFYYNYFKGLEFNLTNSCDCGVGSSNPSKDVIDKRIKTLKRNMEKEILKVNKPILKIDINTGEIVERYLTAGEAAKKNNMRKQRMDELISGKSFKQGNKTVTRIQNRGFRYLRERDYDPNKDYRIRAGKSRAVAQYSLEGELIKEFERINDAVEELNIPAPQIVANCRGNQKTCKGFIFKYIDN